MFLRLRKLVQGTEGTIMVLTALGLVAFLGFASLAIDMGHLYVVRNELQNVADAAALTGADNLIAPDQNYNAIRDSVAASQKIMEVVQRQSVLSGLTPVPDGSRNDLTVSYGEWNKYTSTWTDMGASVATNSTANGTKVTIVRASGLAFGPVTNFLAGILGHPTSEVAATATAFLDYSNSLGKGPAASAISNNLPLALPDSLLAMAKQDGSKSWWASLFGPSEAIAVTTRSKTFKDLGGTSFYSNNQQKPLFKTDDAYLFVSSTSDSVPGTVVDNIEYTYKTSGVTKMRNIKRGDRLYPISEYQWASNIKTIFNALKQAHTAKKNAQNNNRWRVYVPVYSTTDPVASRWDQGLKMMAKLFSFGPSPAYACFTFWTQSYPGGNVPIYVDGFANVDVKEVQYTTNCDDCTNYYPYLNQLDCMIKKQESCRNSNSITIEIPVDTGTVSPPGTTAGGQDNEHIAPGGGSIPPGVGAFAKVPKLVK